VTTGKELDLQRIAHERHFALRQEAQAAQIELMRLALERAYDSERTATDRLIAADHARMTYARRGQTFAMWYTGVTSAVLMGAGLACIFLAVAGAISQGLGLFAGGVVIAGGVFTGLSRIIGKFIPGQSGVPGEATPASKGHRASPA
jgi:hypothetical protein